MAVAVYDLTEVVIIDATDSNGVLTLSQLSGTTASFSSLSSKVFRIVRPVGHTDILTFKLEAKADGPLIYRVFEVPPIDTMTELVLTDADATNFDNWQ